MNFNNDERVIFAKIVRQFLYLVMIFAFIFGIHRIAKIYGAKTFDENSVMENIQLGLLLLSFFSFGVQARYFVKFRSILLLCASFLLLAVCRELDAVLDHVVPVVHWKFGFLFPVVAIWYALKDKNIIKKILAFADFPAVYLLYLAVIVIIPLGQCIGHGPFVRSIFTNNVSEIKELYEESAEAVGYFIILLASAESWFNLRKKG